MTKTELLELIYNGENSGVEFKRDTVDTHGLAKEIVALANLRGGCVILGVEDDGAVSGLTRAGLEQWVMNVCRDKIRPEIIPHFQIVRDAEPGRDVAIVQIERGWSVHQVWHNNKREYYIRAGSQSRDASPDELQRLFQQRGAFRLEIRPVSGSTLADLDLRRLREYFGAIRRQDFPDEQNTDAWETLLINTELMSAGDGRVSCTVAGLLLFGRNPNRFLPQAGIDAAAYPGTQKDYAAVERSTIRGPLVALGVAGLDATGSYEAGLVEQALHFIKRNAGTMAVVIEGRRVDHPAYPDDVLREAIVNALVHRDYLLSATDIEISVYGDRLEIISPGRLPNDITTERMRVGCRAARNQLLKDVMRDYGYLEHMGMGIPRKIIQGMRAHNGSEPDLLAEDERFTLRLWRRETPLPPGA